MRRAISVRVILLAILASLLLMGCQEKAEPKKPADFFPATVGSTWEYQGDGMEFASFEREIIFAEKNRFQMREDTGGTVMATILEITDDAVIRTFSREEAYGDDNYLDMQSTDNTILLQAPIEKGTKWDIQEGTKEIIDLAGVAETPAGKFTDCLVITTTIDDSILTEYYQAGVGLVKREFQSEGMTVTSNLENYKIEPKKQ